MSGELPDWDEASEMAKVEIYSKECKDQHLIDIGQTLFEWWWGRPDVNRYAPRWEDCDERIQAFWMDGAWRTFQT